MQMRVGVTGRLLQIGAIFLLAMIIFGCKPKKQAELYGTYIADYDIARERLILNKNGTYVQEVTLKSTSKFDVTKGTWTYDPKSGYVFFKENFMVVLDGFRKLNPNYAKPTSGSVAEPADKHIGSILLGAAEGILYKKID